MFNLSLIICGCTHCLNVDPMLSVLAVAVITNISCNLITYSHARNLLLMGYGYHTIEEWMKIGLVISIAGIIIFIYRIAMVGTDWNLINKRI
nr:anion permease [Endozoicomonas arenosclerae]